MNFNLDCIQKRHENDAMDRNIIETAIREGTPFEIEMASGTRIKVNRKEDALLRQSYLIVVDEQDSPHVLPLLTMTGVHYLPVGQSADSM